MIDDVVSPVLHSNEPVNPEAVNTELPQLLATDTTGASGNFFGEPWATTHPLVHPFTVSLTKYGSLFATFIDDVVSPVLHSSVPVVFEAERIE